MSGARASRVPWLRAGARGARGAVRGISAAFRTPGWIHGEGMDDLVVSGRVPGVREGLRDGGPEGDPSPTERRWARTAALGSLRLLARLPAGRWKNTCLYRSVALCLLARESGRSARVALGVRRTGPGAGGIEAHAWLEEESPAPGGP